MVSIHFGNHILNFGIKIVSYLGGQCIYIGLLNNKTVLIWCHFLDHNCKKKKKDCGSTLKKKKRTVIVPPLSLASKASHVGAGSAVSRPNWVGGFLCSVLFNAVMFCGAACLCTFITPFDEIFLKPKSLPCLNSLAPGCPQDIVQAPYLGPRGLVLELCELTHGPLCSYADILIHWIVLRDLPPGLWFLLTGTFFAYLTFFFFLPDFLNQLFFSSSKFSLTNPQLTALG